MKLSEIKLKKGSKIILEGGREFNITSDDDHVYIDDNNRVMAYMPFYSGNCCGYRYQCIGKAIEVK